MGHSADNAYSMEYFLAWALRYGPSMHMQSKRISERFDYPVQSFRTLNAILAATSQGNCPMFAEEAAERCLGAGVSSAKGFSCMLKATMESNPHSGPLPC